MKKLVILVAVIGILSAFSLVQAQVDTLTILHLNDTHSHLLPYGPKDISGNWTWGGMARIASLVGMNRISGGKVMLLHAGDLFLGDFMFQKYVGIAELEIMKALGYDALALGNHEFDLYPSTLKYVLNEAGFPGEGFPILCANLDFSGDSELGYFVKPYTIKEYGDLKIGILGLLTESTNQISNPSPVVVLPPLSVAQMWVDSLKYGLDCDIVILLSHLGVFEDQLLASSVSGIDVIVGGHTHTTLPAPIQIGNTLILQAGEFGRYLGKLTLYLNGESIQNWEYQLQSVDSSVPEEPNLAYMIGTLSAGVEADSRFGPVYTAVVSQARTDIKKPLGEGLFKDSPLGNLVSDALRDKTGTDIAFYPQGFCSQTIYAGPVKGADIWQAIPYGFDEATGLGFKLATFQTDGMSIIYGLEFSVYYLPYVEDFFLHSSNFSYAYNSTSTPGSRVDYSSLLINGQPLNPYSSYTVTVPDGVVPFLGQIPGFQINDLAMIDYFVYTTVKDFMVSHSPVSYYTEGRIADLTIFSDPVQGAIALKEVVDIYSENGSIDNRVISFILKWELNRIHNFLQEGRYKRAIRALKVFKCLVKAQSGRHISPEAGDKLIYLADKLIENIPKPLLAEEKEFEAEKVLPESFQLFQNYPNPFNPQTEIAYSLPEDSYIKLTVYNLLGQKVKALVDEFQVAGARKVIWDGRNEGGERVASGIYFYKLESKNFTQTRKMILTK
jgi:5'-nucleotidase/UDP-sugar diphosphatase